VAKGKKGKMAGGKKMKGMKKSKKY